MAMKIISLLKTALPVIGKISAIVNIIVYIFAGIGIYSTYDSLTSEETVDVACVKNIVDNKNKALEIKDEKYKKTMSYRDIILKNLASVDDHRDKMLSSIPPDKKIKTPKGLDLLDEDEKNLLRRASKGLFRKVLYGEDTIRDEDYDEESYSLDIIDNNTVNNITAKEISTIKITNKQSKFNKSKQNTKIKHNKITKVKTIKPKVIIKERIVIKEVCSGICLTKEDIALIKAAYLDVKKRLEST